MVFNAEFLWDGIEPEEGQVEFPWKGDADEAGDHMEEIAAIISASDPDIVTLVEVEGQAALDRFNDEFLDGSGYQTVLVKGKDTFTGQDIGILTRFPALESFRTDERRTSGSEEKGVSKNLIATFEVGDVRFGMVGLHFLSGPTRTDRVDARQAQALVIRAAARELAARGLEVIVLGDFNDYEDEPAARDHANNEPITNVLATVRTMDPGDPDDDLINVAVFAPRAQRYTAFYDKNDNEVFELPGEASSIDHILLSPGLAERVEDVTFLLGHDPVTVSDHFPIIVTLAMEGSPSPAPVADLRIVRLVPNPRGSERENESITLVNPGSATAALDGWVVRDLADTIWSLDGLQVAAGAELDVLRGGQPMNLNNRGDTIELIDPSGRIRQVVTYGRAEDGEVVEVSDT